MAILTQELEIAISFFRTLAKIIVVAEPVGKAQPTIFVGDEVYFFDDESETWGYGTFEGLYRNLNQAGETSPYWTENAQGIHRVLIRETMLNGTVRPNYALPGNVYGLGEQIPSRLN